MAGEITFNRSGQISRGTTPYNITGELLPPGSTSYDSTSNKRNCIIHACTTSDVSLTALLPDTATIEGFLYIKNLDATNYVSFGPTSGGAIVKMVRVNPGKEAFIPLEPGLTLRCQANTGTCDCDIRLYAGNGSAGA